jgi:hypothetical protein
MKVINLKKRIDDMVYITGYSVKKYKSYWTLWKNTTDVGYFEENGLLEWEGKK